MNKNLKTNIELYAEISIKNITRYINFLKYFDVDKIQRCVTINPGEIKILRDYIENPVLEIDTPKYTHITNLY